MENLVGERFQFILCVPPNVEPHYGQDDLVCSVNSLKYPPRNEFVIWQKQKLGKRRIQYCQHPQRVGRHYVASVTKVSPFRVVGEPNLAGDVWPRNFWMSELVIDAFLRLLELIPWMQVRRSPFLQSRYGTTVSELQSLGNGQCLHHDWQR